MNKNSGKILALVAILAMVVCALAVAMPASDGETIQVNDTATFADALADANDGDTIVLADGEYGKVAVTASETIDDSNIIYYDETNGYTSFSVDKKVTITAAAGATPEIYGSLVITAAGVTVENLDFYITFMSYTTERNAITIASSEATVKGCTFTMAEDSSELCNGICIFPTEETQSYTITGNEFVNFVDSEEWSSVAILSYADTTIPSGISNGALRFPEGSASYTSTELTASIADQLAMVAANTFTNCNWKFSEANTDDNDSISVVGNFAGTITAENSDAVFEVGADTTDSTKTVYTLIFVDDVVTDLDLNLQDNEVFVVSGTGETFVGAEYNGTVSYGDTDKAKISGLVGTEQGVKFSKGSVVISGTIDASEAVTITASGEVAINNVVITGTTTTSGGLTVTVDGSASGTVTINSLNIETGAKLTVGSASVVVAQGAELNVAKGGELAIAQDGELYVAGSVTGDGTVTGTVTVAADTGSVSVPGVTPEKDYNVLANVVNGITNGDGWSYDATKGILTLNGYKGEGYFYATADIVLNEVIINGENTVTVTQELIDAQGVSYFAAIKKASSGSLTISGNGTLDIILSEGISVSSGKYAGGIYSNYDIIVEAEVTVTNNANGTGFYGIMAGQYNGSDLTGLSTVTVNNESVVADVICGTLKLNDAAIDGSVIGTIVITGDVTLSEIDGSYTVPAGSTIIVDTLTIEGGETLAYNNAAIIVKEKLVYNPSEGSNIIVTLGIPQQIMANQIYLAEGATYSGKVSPIEALNPISGEYTNNINIANDIIASGYDVSIISLEAVDIKDLVGAEDVIITIGSIKTTENKIFVGTIATNSANATVNGVYMNVTGKGMTIIGAETDVADKYTVTVTGTAISGLVQNNAAKGQAEIDFTNVSAGEAGITFKAGSVEISGDIILNGQSVSSVVITNVNHDDVTYTNPGEIILGDATITGKGTLNIKNLTIAGDVEIGSDVVINVAEGSTFTVEKDGYLSGTGTVDVKTKATILVYGEIADTVTVKTPVEGVTVSDAEEFVSALQYYDKIVVDGAVVFDENSEIPKTVTVTGKTINFTYAGDEDATTTGSMKITDGYTVNFVDTIVNAVKNEIIVEKGATIGINESDIYCAVDAQSGSTVNATNNVTDITGSSIYLEKVGFGNIVNFSNNYTLGSESTFTVYGTINVAEGYTLTIAKGAMMNLVSSADLTVAGTLDVKGTLAVAGTADVTGTLNVTGLVVAGAGSEVVIDGTMNMTGTMAGKYYNRGTVNVNGVVSYDDQPNVEGNKLIDTSIVMYDGATLNIEKATGTINVTSESAYQAPTNGDEKNTIVIKENSLTLTDVEGLVVAATEAVESETVDKKTTVTYTMNFDLSGAVTAGTIYVNAITDDVETGATEDAGTVTVSQTLSLAKGVKLINNETIDVTGTVTVAIDGTFTNNGTVDVTGKVDVTREKARNLDLGGKVNATYYQVTGTDSVTRTYTNLADAIVAAATADKKTATAIGEQEIAEGATVTVPADIVLVLEGTIDVKGTLVFNNFEASVSDNEENIFADVRLDADPARTYTSLANAIAMGATDITLNRTVELKDDLTIPAGITVSSDEFGIIVGEENKSTKNVTLTVEGAVKLTGDGAIVLNEGADIVKPGDGPKKYKGALVLSGNGYIYQIDTEALQSDVAGAYYTKIVDGDGDAETEDPITVDVISTVTYAAADSKNVSVGNGTEGTITIRGTVTAGDVAFTVPVTKDENAENTLVIIIERGAKLTAGSITIVPGITVEAKGAVGGSDAAQVTASIGSAVGTVDLVKATGFTIVSVAADEEADEPKPEMLTIAGDVTGTIEISVGTVTVPGELDVTGTEENASAVAVASGATLDVDGTVTADKNTDVTVAGTLDVAGEAYFSGEVTVAGTVSDKGTVYFDGKSVIDGTVSVEGSESETGDVSPAYLVIADGTVNGTIDANEYSAVLLGGTDTIDATRNIVIGKATVTGTVNAEGILVLGNITLGDLGTEAYELGTAVSGEINAVAPEGEDDQVTLAGYVKAYYGTTVAGLGDDVKSTAYNINGKVYMTVYVAEDTDKSIMSIVYAEKFNLTENGLALDTGLYYGNADENLKQNSELYNPANWYKSSNMLPNTILTGSENIGDANAKTVYATVETIPVSVTVTVTNGLTLYIDGMPQISDRITLSVGEHTVFIQPQAGYKADNATISFAGQTIVTGTGQATIVLTADMEDAVLFATGAEQTSGDITIDVPGQEPPVIVTNGDDEMSLTDYLLIVLVVLIVIMAIIVALRLMRS